MEYLDFVLAGNPVPAVERETAAVRTTEGPAADAGVFKEPPPRPNLHSARSPKPSKPETRPSASRGQDSNAERSRITTESGRTMTDSPRVMVDGVKGTAGYAAYMRAVAEGTKPTTDSGRIATESSRISTVSAAIPGPASAQGRVSNTRDICQFIQNARRVRAGVLARSGTSAVFPRARIIPAPSLHTIHHIGGVRRMSVTSTVTSTTSRIISSTATITTPIVATSTATIASADRMNPVFGNIFPPQRPSPHVAQLPSTQQTVQQSPSAQLSREVPRSSLGGTMNTMSIINKLNASNKPPWSLKQEVQGSALDFTTQRTAPPKAISAHRKQKLKRLLRLS